MKWIQSKIKRTDDTSMEIVSIHKFRECYKFKFGESFMYDMCDALFSEYGLQCTGAVFDYENSAKDSDAGWIMVDFTKQNMESVDASKIEVDVPIKADEQYQYGLSDRGWLIVDHENLKIYTNDNIFRSILEYVFMEYYNFEHLFTILKNIHHIARNIVGFHCGTVELDHVGDTFLELV